MARFDPLQPFLHGDPLKTAGVDFAALTGRIGHAFARPELAIEALTHRGALDRRPDLKAAFPFGNERLEFLGDRVLSLAMSQQLLRRFPREGEGHIAWCHLWVFRDRLSDAGIGARLFEGWGPNGREGEIVNKEQVEKIVRDMDFPIVNHTYTKLDKILNALFVSLGHGRRP